MWKEQTFVRSMFTCLISAVVIFSKPKLAISALISSRTLVKQWVYLRSKYLKSGLSPRICALWLLYLCREWGHTNAWTFMSNIKRQLKSKVKVTPNVHEQRNKLCYIHTMEYWAEITAYLWLSICRHLPGGSVIKTPPANAGDWVSIPESERSPGEGNGNPLQ